jgi:hypothetical protein
MSKPLIEGWPKALAWTDFRKVRTAPDPARKAHIEYALTPSHQKAKQRLGVDTWGLTNLKMRVRLNPTKTWIAEGKEDPDVLRHEQGHFDIGGLIAREWWGTLRFTSGQGSADLAQKISAVERKKLSKSNRTNLQYDRETRHGEDLVQQNRWDQLLKKLKTGTTNLPEPR